MFEATTAISIFGKILDVFGLVKSGKIKRNKQVDLVLQKTHQAIVETRTYIRIARAQQPDYEKEKKKQSANLWYEASIPMRYADKELAKIFSLKGDYRSNPNGWDDMRSGESDISLKKVEELTLELLTNK